MMTQGSHGSDLWLLLAVVLVSSPVLSASGSGTDRDDRYRVDTGFRGGVFGYSDNPAGDIRMVACNFRRPIDAQWFTAISLDFILFECDNMPSILGIHTAEEEGSSEGPGEMTLLVVSLGRTFMVGPDWFRPYMRFGLGVGVVDARNTKGTSREGVSFTVETDADDDIEIVHSTEVGSRFTCGEAWYLEAGARCDYHFADWQITDLESQRTARIDRYTAYGMFVGFGKGL